MTTITLWHGGRNLESQYTNHKSSKKGRWEHGPGLYLTTHYDTAYGYSKGGGKTYMVEVEAGNDIRHVLLDIHNVNNFISKFIIASKRKELLNDLYDNMHRMNMNSQVNAEVVLNLIINSDAISNTKTHELTKFFVENGIDYGVVTRFKGRNENVLVVYNKEKIKKITSISAKDVSLDQWELPFFEPSAKKLKL